MSGKYWEEEEAKVVDTGKNVLRWYEKADKLQVSMPNWGEGKQGKTVTLDLCAVAECEEAVALLRQLIDGMEC